MSNEIAECWKRRDVALKTDRSLRVSGSFSRRTTISSSFGQGGIVTVEDTPLRMNPSASASEQWTPSCSAYSPRVMPIGPASFAELSRSVPCGAGKGEIAIALLIPEEAAERVERVLAGAPLEAVPLPDAYAGADSLSSAVPHMPSAPGLLRFTVTPGIPGSPTSCTPSPSLSCHTVSPIEPSGW